MLLNGTLRRIRDQTVNNTLFIENEDGNANLIATVCVYVLLFNNLNEMLKDIGENVSSCVHQFSGLQKLQMFVQGSFAQKFATFHHCYTALITLKSKSGWGLVQGAWPIVARCIYHHLC